MKRIYTPSLTSPLALDLVEADRLMSKIRSGQKIYFARLVTTGEWVRIKKKDNKQLELPVLHNQEIKI